MHFRLQDMTWEDARALARPGTVVVMPLGAIEQHGPHLPLEVDSRLASEVAARSVERAGERMDVILAPVVSFGASSHHLGFAGTMSVSLQTYIQLLVDLAESIVAGGFRHIFFLNGHGGNADPMRVAIRMLRDRHPDLVVAGASYWDLARGAINATRVSPPGGMSHACELETSLMLHVTPQTVKQDRIANAVPRWTSAELTEDLAAGGGGVALGYHMSDVTPTGVMGDPTVASAEAGSRFLTAIAARVAEVLVDFSGWRMNALVAGD